MALPKKAKTFIKALIQKGSNLLGVDLAYYLQGGIWTTMLTVSEALTNALFTLIFANVASQAIFGEYRFYLSVLGILTIASLPGMKKAVVQSVARGYSRSYPDGMRVMIKYSLIGVLGALITAGYFLYTGSYTAAIYFTLTAFALPFLYPFTVFSDFLVGMEKFREYSIAYTLTIVFKNLALIGIVVVTKRIEIIVFIHLFATFIVNFIAHLIVKRQYSEQIQKAKRHDLKLPKYGLHLTGIQTLTLISSHIDKVIVTFFLGVKAVAVYAVALTVAHLTKTLLLPLILMLIPRLTRQKSTKKTQITIRKKTPLIFLLSAAASFAGIFITPFVIQLFFPLEYMAAIPYAQVLFVGYIFLFPNTVYEYFFLARKKTKMLYTIKTVSPGFRILALFVLTFFFGIWGAVIAQVVGEAFLFFQQYFFLRRAS